MERMMKMLRGDDLDFYEEYLVHLNDEELERFYEANPEFMADYDLTDVRKELLKDSSYRKILKAIYAEEKKNGRTK